MAKNNPRTPAEGGRVDAQPLRPAPRSKEQKPVDVPRRPAGGREGGATKEAK
jgi:hypothetical protein